MKAIKYNSSEITAKNFSDYVNTENKTLSPKTHGRFDLKKTHWWVVPGTDWPVHNFGKYIFKEEGPLIKAGLTVEKGLGEDASKVSPTGLLLDDSWQWYKFREDLKNSIVEERIRKVKSENGELLLEIGIERVEDPPNYDPHYYKKEKYIFEFDEEANTSFKEEESTSEEFSELESLSSIGEVIDIINDFDNKDWIWIDFDFVVPLLKRGEANEDTELISEFHLGAILQPLGKWIA
ncbi:hypothetical protein [Halarsenatibacter silvermanii]|uniref:Uncharacterized protein n=1 Tax=Halarsenatibacter silvermanii TaxID=321763 RepID=A0A1G9J0K1_9FIRM|nr:hypothetical protein [Halarsenatibacter silvermanii]SDL31037.1 hypothetical protein SAMN04488692_103109 [Halarsenatibacter silvermanii]